MLRRLSLVLVSLAAVLLGACGDSSDELALDTDSISEAGFLGAVVDRSTDEGFDYVMRTDIDLSFPGAPPVSARGVVLGEGHVLGATSSFHMDLGEISRAMGSPPPALFGGDLTMEVITDGDAGVTYLRAPFLAGLADQPGIPASGLGGLETLGDDWGRVEHDALGDAVPTEIVSQLSAGAVGFEPMIALVRGAEDAREVGTDVIDGVAVTGVAADVTFEDLLALSGMDLDRLMASFGGSTPETDATVEAMTELTIPITIWIDDEQRVVRIEFALDLGPFLDRLAADFGEDVPGGVEMAFGYTIDMTNFGSPGAIEFPAESIDITDSYRELLTTLTGS